MNNPLILTFDCGTQSLRALLVDKDGNIVGKSQEKFEKPYYSTKPEYAEQSIDFYWDKLGKASRALKAKCGQLWQDILCVTLSPIRDSFTCLDKDGKVLRDLILYSDSRMAECKKPLPLLTRTLFNLVGMGEAMDVQRKITHSNWIKENEPKIWAKTDKYMSLGGILSYLLTGEKKDAVAGQIGHIPFDYKNKKWKKPSNYQFPLFGVEEHMLPELVEIGGELGHITKQASEHTGIVEGMPLVATGSDKGCETLGVGAVSTNVASLSFGTCSTVQLTTDKYVEPSKFLPAYPALIDGMYNPEVQIFRGYWMISWFLKEFAEKEVKQARELGCSPEELLNKELASIPIGCDGLSLQPYWAPQLKNPEARGSIIGFTAKHTRAHIYRAIIEGIGYALYDGFLTLKKRSGQNIEYLTVSGGGSQSDEICQMTADLFGLPVRRIQTYETTGLGSSMIGFIYGGVYKDYKQAVEHMVRYTDEFTPDANSHKLYTRLYNDVYKDTYSYLQPLYYKIYNITKEQAKLTK